MHLPLSIVCVEHLRASLCFLQTHYALVKSSNAWHEDNTLSPSHISSRLVLNCFTILNEKLHEHNNICLWNQTPTLDFVVKYHSHLLVSWSSKRCNLSSLQSCDLSLRNFIKQLACFDLGVLFDLFSLHRHNHHVSLTRVQPFVNPILQSNH